jgi:hypothetical protein
LPWRRIRRWAWGRLVVVGLLVGIIAGSLDILRFIMGR